jgi:hypothetical protein
MSDPSDMEVDALIRDFEEDFGVRLPFGEARRMLVLYDELHELFEQYGGSDDWSFQLPGLPSEMP